MLTKAELKLFEEFEKGQGIKARRLFAGKDHSCCLGSYTPLGHFRYGVFYGIGGFYKIEPGTKQESLSVKAGLMLARHRGGFTVKAVIARINADSKRIKNRRPT